jgi:hypothetical protein
VLAQERVKRTQDSQKWEQKREAARKRIMSQDKLLNDRQYQRYRRDMKESIKRF